MDEKSEIIKVSIKYSMGWYNGTNNGKDTMKQKPFNIARMFK